LKELDSDLEAQGRLMGETAVISGNLADAGLLPRGIGPEETATFVANFDDAATVAFAGGIARLSGENAVAIADLRAIASRFEARRRDAAAREELVPERNRGLEELRARLETARADLVAQKTLLAEAERESGSDDPEPAFDAAKQSLAALEAERRDWKPSARVGKSRSRRRELRQRRFCASATGLSRRSRPSSRAFTNRSTSPVSFPLPRVALG